MTELESRPKNHRLRNAIRDWRRDAAYFQTRTCDSFVRSLLGVKVIPRGLVAFHEDNPTPTLPNHPPETLWCDPTGGTMSGRRIHHTSPAVLHTVCLGCIDLKLHRTASCPATLHRTSSQSSAAS